MLRSFRMWLSSNVVTVLKERALKLVGCFDDRQRFQNTSTAWRYGHVLQKSCDRRDERM